jgi:hypothetical protein
MGKLAPSLSIISSRWPKNGQYERSSPRFRCFGHAVVPSTSEREACSPHMVMVVVWSLKPVCEVRSQGVNSKPFHLTADVGSSDEEPRGAGLLRRMVVPQHSADRLCGTPRAQIHAVVRGLQVALYVNTLCTRTPCFSMSDLMSGQEIAAIERLSFPDG